MAILNFNANSVDPASVFEAIPAGKYQAVISDSTMKPTKSGSGQYLELAFDIIEGEFKDRKLWSRLNLENPNPKAVEIAMRELSAICHAVGVLEPRDSTELHNLPLTVTVRCRKNQDDELVNEIKGFGPRENAVLQKPAGAPTPTATATKAAPPWARGK